MCFSISFTFFRRRGYYCYLFVLCGRFCCLLQPNYWRGCRKRKLYVSHVGLLAYIRNPIVLFFSCICQADEETICRLPLAVCSPPFFLFQLFFLFPSKTALLVSAMFINSYLVSIYRTGSPPIRVHTKVITHRSTASRSYRCHSTDSAEITDRWNRTKNNGPSVVITESIPGPERQVVAWTEPLWALRHPSHCFFYPVCSFRA